MSQRTSLNAKLSNSQLNKLKSAIRKLLKTGLPLITNVIQPLAKSVLIPLGLSAAASTADAGIHPRLLQ